MQNTGILVTGGAGYIGSHVVKQLGDTGDRELVSQLLVEHEIDSVLHFSATGSYQNQSTTR